MLPPKSRRNFLRIIPIGLIWFVFSLVYCLLERGLLGHLHSYPSTGNPYSFSSSILSTSITALVAGLLIGAIEISYFNKLFLHKSFTKKIVYKTLGYFGIIISFLLGVTVLVNAAQLHTGIFTGAVWTNVWAFFFNFSFLSVSIYMAVTIVVSQFYTEVSENIGPNVLVNFFTGKYHTPKEEERIFMFLDMASSTTIAENLGHARYFTLLRSYYSDLSDPIINYSGEIYQYVGDEIVVSWTLGNGLQDNNCIRCFFAMKAVLLKQSASYEERFGLVPQFKAALHLGKVITGEIGALKKEIVFSGDVLNTTARIQGLCNAYKTDLLLSGDLVKKLSPNDRFAVRSFGENELRGRGEKIELFTILTA
jgi:class 3 adenylate cyclase